MAKVDSIACPTPGCGRTLKVKLSKHGKPTVFCDDCGFQGFVRYRRGVEMWLGEAQKETPPARAASGVPGDKGEKKDPPAKGKGGKDVWDL